MPQTNAKIFGRKRINKLLTNMFSFPLTIIHATMGYGKTIAVKQFLKTKDIHTVWVSLAESNGSVNFFWERMTSQLMKLDQKLGLLFRKSGFPHSASKTAKLIDILIDYEYVKPTVIVIDDYQLIEDVKLFSLLKLVALEKIDNLHIVIITRELTKNMASVFYQNQLCFVLSEEALKFKPDEIKSYFELMDCSLSDSELSKVYKYTDGWISMIYLIMRGIQQGLPIGRTNTIDELIEQNLYQPLDDNVRDILLKLSFLDAFTVSLATYVLNDPNTTAILQTIIKGNHFIVYNEFTKQYKIHNLLLGFLSEKAKFGNIDPSDLYKRAGEWHLKQGQYMNAFDFFYISGDVETILSELNKEETPDIHFTQYAQIHRIFDGLTEELCLKYPIAFMQYIRIFSLSGEPRAVSKCKDNLIKMEEYIHNSDLNVRYKNFILGEINVIWTFIVFNDMDKMIMHNKKALEYFSGGCSCIVTRKKEFTYGSPHFLYSYYREKGKLRHTLDTIIDNFNNMIQAADGCGTGCDSVAMAEFAVETGDFHLVELFAYKAIYKAKSAEQLCLIICAKFALARFMLFQGRFNEALDLIEELKEETLKENNPVLNTTFDICQGYLEGCMQRPHMIPEWIQNNDTSSACFMYHGMSYYYLVYGKSILLSGDYLKLDAMCDTFNAHFSRFDNLLGFIHNLIYEAIAKKNLLGTVAGKKVLLRALDIAKEDHILMPFAENAAPIMDLLTEIKKEWSGDADYLNRVIECCETYMAALENMHFNKVLLSNREREILQLLEKGYKHDEIGGLLFISVTTVRYHIKNIYQKLEVNNKVLAITKAKKLNYI